MPTISIFVTCGARCASERLRCAVCSGIAVSWKELPDPLIERHGLQRHARTRGEGEREYHFLFRDKQPLLPVWCERQLQVLPWGNQQRRNGLPLSGICRQEDLEAGTWANHQPEAVEIPAVCALERGVWYQVREGLRGVLVHDRNGTPRVYVLTQPATHYYRIMTRSERMPVLIGQVL